MASRHWAIYTLPSTEFCTDEMAMANAESAKKRGDGKKFRFADVFAGCGGLSLGLAASGWRGVFAVEKSSDAFATLKANLVEGRRKKFDWPEWLPKEAISTADLLGTHSKSLEALQGHIDLLAGGPPCQGFSLAGRRTHSDPRNSLTEDYISVVQKLKPRFLLIENVRGFTLPFKKHGDEIAKTVPYSVRVIERLEKELDYKVFSELVDLSDYGVPQNRKRFILIAIRNGDPALKKLAGKTPFDLLKKRRKHFLGTKGLPHDRAVSVKEAIGDLATEGRTLIDCGDSEVKGFKQIEYRDGIYMSPFIGLMRKKVNKAPDSLRIPRHSESTVSQFRRIAETCPRGRTVHENHRATLGIKKHALTLKVMYLLQGREHFKQRHQEYACDLLDIALLKDHRKAQGLLDAIPNPEDREWQPIKEMLLSIAEISGIERRLDRTARRTLDTQWGFTGLVGELSRSRDPMFSSIAGLCHGYAMSSHILHADTVGTAIALERDCRPDGRRQLVHLAHLSRLIVDQLIYLKMRLMVGHRYVGYVGQSLVEADEKIKRLKESFGDTYKRWLEIEYGSPGDFL